MKDNGKKMRPTTIAYIVLFTFAACALGIGIVLQLTSIFDAAKIMIRFVTPALFVAGVVVALVDVRLNPKLSDQEKSNTTKSVLAMGCSDTASPNAAFLAILPLASLAVPQRVRQRSVSVKLSQNFGVWVQSSFWEHNAPSDEEKHTRLYSLWYRECALTKYHGAVRPKNLTGSSSPWLKCSVAV